MFFGFVLSGMALSYLAVSSCHFLKIVQIQDDDDHGETQTDSNSNGMPSSLASSSSASASASVVVLGYTGLFNIYDREADVCVPYGQDQPFDESEETARAAGMLAPLLGAVALLLMIYEFCCCRFFCSRLFVGLALAAAQLAQGFTFMFFDSDSYCGGDIIHEIRDMEPCAPSHGAVYSIVALVLYFLAGVWTFCTPKPEPMRTRHRYSDVQTTKQLQLRQQQQQQQQQQTPLPRHAQPPPPQQQQQPPPSTSPNPGSANGTTVVFYNHHQPPRQPPILFDRNWASEESNNTSEQFHHHHHHQYPPKHPPIQFDRNWASEEKFQIT